MEIDEDTTKIQATTSMKGKKKRTSMETQTDVILRQAEVNAENGETGLPAVIISQETLKEYAKLNSYDNSSHTTAETIILTSNENVAETERGITDAIGNIKSIPQREDVEIQFNGFSALTTPSDSVPSIGSLVCRICHNADNPEQLVSPCLCKGSLTYVHIQCLERWISTSRCTTCELCQFTYNTEQTLRYSCLQSLRLWYSRNLSRRALQEDCQMFSLLTLVAFGIVGTLLVGIQYYALHTQSWGLNKLWTKSWMLFFLIMTITVYFANVYMLIKSQLTPWYRWWQSARDIRLILENRRPFLLPQKERDEAHSSISMLSQDELLNMEQAEYQDIEQLQQNQMQPEQIQYPRQISQLPMSARMVEASNLVDSTYFEHNSLACFRPFPSINEIKFIKSNHKKFLSEKHTRRFVV